MTFDRAHHTGELAGLYPWTRVRIASGEDVEPAAPPEPAAPVARYDRRAGQPSRGPSCTLSVSGAFFARLAAAARARGISIAGLVELAVADISGGDAAAIRERGRMSAGRAERDRDRIEAGRAAFGAALRAWMRATGRSSTGLGVELGVTGTAVRLWMTGANSARREHLEALVERGFEPPAEAPR